VSRDVKPTEVLAVDHQLGGQLPRLGYEHLNAQEQRQVVGVVHAHLSADGSGADLHLIGTRSSKPAVSPRTSTARLLSNCTPASNPSSLTEPSWVDQATAPSRRHPRKRAGNET
jgi:hypothetical protein